MNNATRAAMIALVASVSFISANSSAQETAPGNTEAEWSNVDPGWDFDHQSGFGDLTKRDSSTYDPSAYYRDVFIAQGCAEAVKRYGGNSEECGVPKHPSTSFEDGMTPADRLLEDMLNDAENAYEPYPSDGFDNWSDTSWMYE